jgi:hypothetical protein
MRCRTQRLPWISAAVRNKSVEPNRPVFFDGQSTVSVKLPVRWAMG